MYKAMVMVSSLLAVTAGTAEAATYVGNRSIGAGSASLSITTDGTIGVLANANILGWTIGLNEGGSTFTLQGPTSGNNSALLISGTAFTATSTDLLFNFSAGTGFALFQNPVIGSSINYYCPQTNFCFDTIGAGEGVQTTGGAIERNSLTGNVVLASLSAGAVPEPASWAMMIIGFAAVGASLRARKVTVSYA